MPDTGTPCHEDPATGHRFSPPSDPLDINTSPPTPDKRRSGSGERLHKAVRLLRSSGLGAAYEQAWAEWAAGDDAADWETVVSDGVA